jgi:transposase-like protein
MMVRIACQRMSQWRGVDDRGKILDTLVQRRRDTRRVKADAQAAQEAPLRADIAG